jgi:hypothetical protein
MAELNIDSISTVVGEMPQTPNAIKQNPQSFNIDDVSTVAPESSSFNTTMQFFAGFNDALFTLPDYSIEKVVNAFADEGLVEKDDVFSLAEFFNQGIPEPKTTTDKVIRTMGVESAKSVPFLVAPYLTASSKLYTGIDKAKTTTEAVVRSMINQIRNSPMGTFLGENIAVLGFGAGTGIAEETKPESSFAQTAYPIAGALAPSTVTNFALKTPTAMVLRFGKKTKDYFGKQGQELRATEDLSNQFKDALINPKAQANLNQTKQIQDSIGDGFSPSPAEASDSPQLIASQKELEGNAQGSTLDALVDRKKKNLKAVEGFKIKNFPSNGDEAPFVINTITKKFDDLSKINNQQTKFAIGKLEDISSKFPVTDKFEQGQTLRKVLIDTRKEAVDEFNQYAKDLGIDLETKIPFLKLKDEIIAEFDPKTAFSDKVNTPDVLKDIKKFNDDSITFNEFKDLRERVSDDLLDELASATPKNTKIRKLTLLKQKLDKYLDEQSSNLGDQYKEFRNAYKERIINRFEKSGAYAVRQTGKTQEYNIANEKVAEAFLKNVDTANQFKIAFTDSGTQKINTEALQSLENVILDQINKTSFKNGVLDPNKLQNYIKKNREVLEQFPEIFNKIKNANTIVNNVSNRIAQLNKRKALIDENLLAKKLSYGSSPVIKGIVDVDQVISDAIKQPSLMYNISNRLKTENEIEALRRSVAKNIFDRVDIQKDPTSLKNFINNNYKSLKYVFSQNHLKNMEVIADAYSIALRTPIPTGSGMTPNSPLQKVSNVTGMGVPSILSRFYSAESGRTSVRYVAGDILGRLFLTLGKKKSDALFLESMFNPKITNELLNFAKNPQSKKTTQKLNLFLFNLGYPQGEE